VPWEILELVRARILKNRARQRPQEQLGELKRAMSLRPGPLSRKRREEEPSFVAGEDYRYIFVTTVRYDAQYSYGPLSVISPFQSQGKLPSNYGYITDGFGYPGYGKSFDTWAFYADKIRNDYQDASAITVFLEQKPPAFGPPVPELTVEVYTQYDEEPKQLIFQGQPGQLGTLEVSLYNNNAKFV
jgi:hypothetical protein